MHTAPPPPSRSVPIPDAVTEFYWQAATHGELVIQGFAGSDIRQFPPEAVAPGDDGAKKALAITVSGRGRLYAYTVLHQAFHPAYVDDGPLVVGLTELDDAPGVRILTNIVDAFPADLTVGMALEVVFEERGEFAIPQFRPVEPNR